MCRLCEASNHLFKNWPKPLRNRSHRGANHLVPLGLLSNPTLTADLSMCSNTILNHGTHHTEKKSYRPVAEKKIWLAVTDVHKDCQ